MKERILHILFADGVLMSFGAGNGESSGEVVVEDVDKDEIVIFFWKDGGFESSSVEKMIVMSRLEIALIIFAGHSWSISH